MSYLEILESFNALRVLVVGDLMLDRYVSGNVIRISPEAPVPVVEWGAEEDRLGGAANVALNVQALGATPYLCGVVGCDAESTRLMESLEAAGLKNGGIVLSGERSTTVKTRIIAGHQHLLRIDKEHTAELTAGEKETFLNRVLKLMSTEKFQVLIFQDYDKGVLSEKVIATLTGEARRQGILIAVDPKFRNFWHYRGVDLFKPNLKEVRDALGISLKSEAHLLRTAAQSIRQRLGNRYTLITLSEKGAFLDDEKSWQLYPTLPRTVADVCGAGDAVISIAALTLACGLDMEGIATLANLAGGQVVEKIGVVPLDKNQLKLEISDWLIAR